MSGQRPENFHSDDLPAGVPDGGHPLHHFWLTAPWRVDGMPPVVTLVRYHGMNRTHAVIQAIHPVTGPQRPKMVSVRNLQWCGVDYDSWMLSQSCP